jgi:ATP-dependent DNA ligase
MQCRAVDRLPEGPEWQYELKFDGYRALAFKTGRRV